jgi:hypothetical protein
MATPGGGSSEGAAAAFYVAALTQGGSIWLFECAPGGSGGAVESRLWGRSSGGGALALGLEAADESGESLGGHVWEVCWAKLACSSPASCLATLGTLDTSVRGCLLPDCPGSRLSGSPCALEGDAMLTQSERAGGSELRWAGRWDLQMA